MTPLPPGWTPYCEGFWPPDGAVIDVLNRDGRTTTVVYTHYDLMRVPPVGWLLQWTGDVVGWRMHTKEGHGHD